MPLPQLKINKIAHSDLSQLYAQSLGLETTRQGRVLRTNAELRLREMRRAITRLQQQDRLPYSQPVKLLLCPAVFTIPTNWKPCHRYNLCPSCWARFVARPYYEHLRAHVFDPGQRDDVRIIRVMGTRRIVCPSGQADEVVNRTIAAEVALRQSWAVRIRRYLGAFWVTTVEPADDATLLVRRSVFACRELPLKFHKLAKADWSQEIEEIAQPTPRQLAALVGRACRYPGGLLEGSAAITAAILRQRLTAGRTRLREAYGWARKEDVSAQGRKVPPRRDRARQPT